MAIATLITVRFSPIALRKFHTKQSTEIFCLFSVLTKNLFFQKQTFCQNRICNCLKSGKSRFSVEERLFYQKKQQKIHIRDWSLLIPGTGVEGNIIFSQKNS